MRGNEFAGLGADDPPAEQDVREQAHKTRTVAFGERAGRGSKGTETPRAGSCPRFSPASSSRPMPATRWRCRPRTVPERVLTLGVAGAQFGAGAGLDGVARQRSGECRVVAAPVARMRCAPASSLRLPARSTTTRSRAVRQARPAIARPPRRFMWPRWLSQTFWTHRAGVSRRARGRVAVPRTNRCRWCPPP